jgi:hypothetical protein
MGLGGSVEIVWVSFFWDEPKMKKVPNGKIFLWYELGGCGDPQG